MCTVAVTSAQLYVFSDNLWSTPSVSGEPPSRGGGAIWVSGGVVFVHGGRRACGRGVQSRTSDVGWVDARTMEWGRHTVAPADAASEAMLDEGWTALARQQHCALPLDPDSHRVLLFGGQSRGVGHFWMLDTRTWRAQFVPLSGDAGIPLHYHATQCVRSGDLVYYTTLFIRALDYTEQSMLGCFNLTSQQFVLLPNDPPFPAETPGLTASAPEAGFVIQLNATSLLLGGGCDKTDEAACEYFRNTTWVVHGLDTPHQLRWVRAELRNRGPLPAGLFSSASFRCVRLRTPRRGHAALLLTTAPRCCRVCACLGRPEGMGDRQGPLSALYADEPVGWAYPGHRKHVLQAGPLYRVDMVRTMARVCRVVCHHPASSHVCTRTRRLKRHCSAWSQSQCNPTPCRSKYGAPRPPCCHLVTSSCTEAAPSLCSGLVKFTFVQPLRMRPRCTALRQVLRGRLWQGWHLRRLLCCSLVRHFRQGRTFTQSWCGSTGSS